MRLDVLLEHFNLSGKITGQVLKYRCPFHDGSSSKSAKTLWVSATTGGWSCWSSRCRFHGKLRPLEDLLVLQGCDARVAAMQATTVELMPKSKPGELRVEGDFELEEDEDSLGRLREPHLRMWEVDWPLAEEVLRRVENSGKAPTHSGLPVSSWIETAAVPGMIEHDHWMDLRWVLRQRGISVEALTTMNVGFSRMNRVFSFPLREFGGNLIGWARRSESQHYHVMGTVLQPGDEGYSPIHVDKAQVLWGAHELRDRISRGEDVYLVEGFFDQLKLLGIGKVALALLGKSLTDEQLEYLRGLGNKIILWPDFDEPGLEAARKILRKVGHHRMHVVFAPERKDAGDMNRLQLQACTQRYVPGEEYSLRFQDILHALRSA